MQGMVEEVAAGRGLHEDGLSGKAYMHQTYSQAFMILEAESIEAARARFDAYPQVRQGLIAFEFTPLVGMPAVAQVREGRGTPLPSWWPPG